RERRREAEVFLRLGVVGALDREVDRLAEFLLALGVDVLHVDELLFIRRRRPLEENEIVALLRRRLGGHAGGQAGDADVVDDHLRVVFLTPFFDVGLVDPLVECRYEVPPLEVLEGFFRRRAVAFPRQRQRRAETGADGARRGRLDEIASRPTFFRHRSLLWI